MSIVLKVTRKLLKSNSKVKIKYLLERPAGPTCLAGSVIEPTILTIVSLGITCFITFTALLLEPWDAEKYLLFMKK